MNQDTWTAVDDYFEDMLHPEDAALTAALKASDDAGLPAIQVSSSQGKMLMLMATMQGARRILEIGTLGGYSTIWLARALPPDGRLISLEIDPRHAEVARTNITRAKLSDLVEIRLGRALDLLPKLAIEGGDPFDFVFIDADKQSGADYFEWAVTLSRKGSVIIVDNVVRKGEVIDPENEDPNIKGTRRLMETIAADPRVNATVIQTVGSKGYDGFLMAVVTG